MAHLLVTITFAVPRDVRLAIGRQQWPDQPREARYVDTEAWIRHLVRQGMDAVQRQVGLQPPKKVFRIPKKRRSR